MASVCELCGKKPSFGMNLSHSHRRTKRRWNPNIQKVRALVDGTPKRLNVCTSCLRAGRVTKPSRTTYSASCPCRQPTSGNGAPRRRLTDGSSTTRPIMIGARRPASAKPVVTAPGSGWLNTSS